MATQNIKEIRQLTREELDQEILLIKKELLNLRFKKSTRQSFQPHLFKRYRRRLAQLLTIYTERNK
uniref:ribosomal protein L29 n=1 Tax=Glaucosphaera vacuolata TaxID=38265 RepID=UPI001FCE24A6|nr:ribosomal protein L29 [Glaucosphaera vacuolata]UNJ18730.1 ribosomal protein L29 [Glaucosphaera vacuolata]